MRQVHVLIVDDSATDVLLTRQALRGSGVLGGFHSVDNGEDALLFLRRQGSFASAVRPDVILLDLHLPRKSGREVLIEIKADPELSHIPVIMFSSSRAEEDVFEAYRSHANCFVSKPLDGSRFGEMLRSIEHFWSSVATLPRACS